MRSSSSFAIHRRCIHAILSRRAHVAQTRRDFGELKVRGMNTRAFILFRSRLNARSARFYRDVRERTPSLSLSGRSSAADELKSLHYGQMARLPRFLDERFAVVSRYVTRSRTRNVAQRLHTNEQFPAGMRYGLKRLPVPLDESRG